jgi:Kef-type K+ transport system membrane component KefB
MNVQGYDDIPLTLPAGALGSAALDTIFVAKAALFFAILLLTTIGVSKVLKRWFNLPVIAGQIIAGVLLGPSCLNLAQWAYFSAPLYIFDYTTQHVYALVSSDLFIFFLALLASVFTISYLLWIAGHETDLKEISQVGIPAVTAGFFGAVLPVIMSWVVLYYGWYESISTVQAISMGLIFSATSVSIPIAMLLASNKMHLKTSQATLGAAIIDDILAVMLLSLFFIGIQTGTFGDQLISITDSVHTITIGEAIVFMLLTFVIFGFIGYYCIPPIGKWLNRRRYFYLVPAVASTIMLIYFAFAELIGGLAGITGAYFAGLFHRLGDKTHRADKVIAPFVNAILLPLFLGSIGLTVDVTLLHFEQWVLVGVLLMVAIVSKLLACFIAAAMGNVGPHKWSGLEGYIFGSSMVARGEVGLVMATILYGARLIPVEFYTISLVIIVLTTIASPIMLAIGFSLLDRRMGRLTGQEYSLTLGRFKTVGTKQLFNSIVGYIESTHGFHPTIQMSEGLRIITLESPNIQIIFSPNRGITFKGDKTQVAILINAVREKMIHELERLAPL